MHKLSIILLFLLFQQAKSQSDNSNDFKAQGFIVNTKSKDTLPLALLKIQLSDSSIIYSTADFDGYFRFSIPKKEKDSITISILYPEEVVETKKYLIKDGVNFNILVNFNLASKLTVEIIRNFMSKHLPVACGNDYLQDPIPEIPILPEEIPVLPEKD